MKIQSASTNRVGCAIKTATKKCNLCVTPNRGQMIQIKSKKVILSTTKESQKNTRQGFPSTINVHTYIFISILKTQSKRNA